MVVHCCTEQYSWIHYPSLWRLPFVHRPLQSLPTTCRAVTLLILLTHFQSSYHFEQYLILVVFRQVTTTSTARCCLTHILSVNTLE